MNLFGRGYAEGVAGLIKYLRQEKPKDLSEAYELMDSFAETCYDASQMGKRYRLEREVWAELIAASEAMLAHYLPRLAPAEEGRLSRRLLAAVVAAKANFAGRNGSL